jgi:ATP synthase F1 gamma subunit
MFKLTKINKERKFNRDIADIINALKGVASSEFYRLQKTRKQLEQFAEYLHDFFQMINVANMEHRFFQSTSLPAAMVLVTSDIGFLGKLNISVVNTALDQSSGSEKLIIVGKQGVRYIEETGKDFISFTGISDNVSYHEAENLANFLAQRVGKEFGRITVVYPHFISFSLWQVQTFQLLPCRFLFRDSVRSEWEEELIVEPSYDKIIDDLVIIWMAYILYGIYWESKLSEWAARVIHLESSANKIKQRDRKLRFQYFHLLHEISDKNIREIFASKLAPGRR